MLLSVDIGNTNITLGIFREGRLLKRFSIPTKGQRYLPELRRIRSRYPFTDAVICSVVPEVTKALAQALKRIVGKAPYIIGKDIKIPVKNRYRKPGQVGQDRLVNAYAGIVLYGAPLVVVDFGTAITFDVVSKKAEYLGGMILPGLASSLCCLAEKTALLPNIPLSKPKEFIGRDTKASMLSGIVYGFSSLTQALVEKIRKEIGKSAKAIGTGGAISLISPYCRCFDAVDADLTLKGLNMIYAKILQVPLKKTKNMV